MDLLITVPHYEKVKGLASSPVLPQLGGDRDRDLGSGASRAGSENKSRAEQSSVRTRRGSFQLGSWERLLEVAEKGSTCVYTDMGEGIPDGEDSRGGGLGWQEE